MLIDPDCKGDKAKDKIVELTGELATLRGELKEKKRWYDKFLADITKYIPESYDDDAAAEAIILKWAKDVNERYQIKINDTLTWKNDKGLFLDHTIVQALTHPDYLELIVETDNIYGVIRIQHD